MGAAVRSARASAHPSASLTVTVIADNCTDGTVEVAREAGAQVLVRNEPDRRGKGHALAWG